MSRPTLTPEPQAEAQPIADTLMEAAREEISAIAELLASKPDHQLLGRTEFEVRDRVHKIGAKAIETALNGRKKGGIQGPVGSACWARSCAKTVPTTGARPVTRATSPGIQLGLSACKPTPAAEELMTMAGTLDRFADAAEKLLPEMSGLQPSESPVQRTAEAAGERLGEVWGEGRTLGSAADWRGAATPVGEPLPPSALMPQASACRAQAVPRPKAAWPGWARASTPAPSPPRRPRSRTRQERGIRPG